MANSDYIARGFSKGFCPNALLSASITRLQTSVVMTDFESSIPDGLRVGMAALIDSEIISIDAVSGNTLTIGRGCCDTIPALHDAGARIWFFDDSVSNNGIEYGATESIGVKVLPRTASGGYIPMSAAPPNALVFNWRFARPYPPGIVTMNGNPWYTSLTMGVGIPQIVLSWVHRNRITQQDQLIPHGHASITPEAGTTYRLRFFRENGSLVKVVEVSGTTYTYTWAEAFTDFESSGGTVSCYVELTALRDGLDSFQPYRINFNFDGNGPANLYGLGYRLGQDLGGVGP